MVSVLVVIAIWLLHVCILKHSKERDGRDFFNHKTHCICTGDKNWRWLGTILGVLKPLDEPKGKSLLNPKP